MPTIPIVGKRADPLEQVLANYLREKAASGSERSDHQSPTNAADVLIYRAYLAAQIDKKPH